MRWPSSSSLKSSVKIVKSLPIEQVGFKYGYAIKGGICGSLIYRSCNSKSNIDKDTLKSDNIINKPAIRNTEKKTSTPITKVT